MDTGNCSNPLVTFGVVDVAQSSYAQLRIFWRLGGYHATATQTARRVRIKPNYETIAWKWMRYSAFAMILWYGDT